MGIDMEGVTEVTQVIATQNISYMVMEVCIAVLLPLALLILWKVKKNAEFLPTVAGACVYFAFAIVGRQVLDLLFLGTNTPISVALSGSVWAMAGYTALLTGLLEETGRFICFKFILGDEKNRIAAVSYGIGHGGLESMYVLGYTVVSYVLLAVQLNGIGMEGLMAAIGTQDPEPYLATIEGIKAVGLPQVLLAFYERLLFMIFQISLSVMVFTAVYDKKKIRLFPIAMLLHSGLEMIMAVGGLGLVAGLPVAEVLLLIYVAVTAFFAFRSYQKLPEK